MTSTDTLSSSQPTLSMRRVWTMGLIGVLASIIANVVWIIIARAIFNPPSSFEPLQLGRIIIFTAFFTLIAVVVFAILVRLTRNPIRIFRIVAVIVLVLSIVPDIMLLVNPQAVPVGEVTTTAVFILIVAHIIAAAIMIYALTMRTVEPA